MAVVNAKYIDVNMKAETLKGKRIETDQEGLGCSQAKSRPLSKCPPTIPATHPKACRKDLYARAEHTALGL